MMSSFEKVFQALNQHKVKYLVVGGVALNLLGVNRFTMDIDLMLELERENLLRLIKTMKKMGYSPRVPVPAEALADEAQREKWRKEKNAIVFTFIHNDMKLPIVDLFLSNPIVFDDAYAHKKIISAETCKIPVISKKHLIKLKKIAGRQKDILDIESLKKKA